MKKSVIILWITVLSLLFYEGTINHSASLNSLVNTENSVSSSVQIEDNCQEDNIKGSDISSVKLLLQKGVYRTLCPFIISVAEPLVWQPPE
jgi:arabinogalactan endo-1,4-beta-galactosidase